MSKVPKIGPAADKAFLHELLDQGDVMEALVVVRRQGENGAEWTYEHTRLSSKFAMSGALHWVQSELSVSE